jgi:cysteine desulfurase
MTAQNEIGTVQPIGDLARATHEFGALFHTDAVQALGKIPFDVGVLGIDAATLSAHKIGGPKGVGAFYLRNTAPFEAMQLGGGQELHRRSGTQNVVGAVGFACAVELACDPQRRTAEGERLVLLRDHLAAQLIRRDIRISLTMPVEPGDTTRHLPTLLPLLVSGFESETLILALDDAGFAVSGGSACSTGSLEPSHVLTALGIAPTRAYGALRLSLGPTTTRAHCDAFIEALYSILAARK